MSAPFLRVARAVVVLLVAALPLRLDAQSDSTATAGSGTVSRQFETRAQLQAQLTAAETQRRTAEAFLLRLRLQRGDFQEGDRIVILVEGSQTVLDTMRVRTGKVLQFPRMGELSLEGILRSELQDTVRHHLSRYLNSPSIRATPLIPLAVIGNVMRQGYHYVPADIVLRDVIMIAGGPNPTADLNKVHVRRAGEVIWDQAALRVALSDGISVDGLHLRAGDEIVVPERRRMQMSQITAIVSTSLAATLAIMQLFR